MTAPQGSPMLPAGAAGERWRGDDLRALFGRSTAVFALLTGPAHVLETANPAFLRAVGVDGGRTGRPIGELMPELAAQGFIDLMDTVYRTGRPHTAGDARVVLGADGAAREAFFDFTYDPRRDEAGNVVGVTVLGVETTQVKHSQRLAAEQRALLEQIVRDQPLDQVLEGMARTIEELSPGVIVSVLLADPDGRHLRHGVAPSLPDFYNRGIDGIAVGEDVGSCGTAAHRREPVVVTDIRTDPRWRDFRHLAEAAGLAACWSTPILTADGELLGTFAMYHRAPRAPQEEDLALSAVFARTAALAVERHRAERARAAAEAKERAARQDLAFILEASTVLARDLDVDETLQRLARLAVPALAPLCTVDVLQAGRVRRVAAAAPTRAQEDLLASRAPGGDADGAVARVLASGTTEIGRRAPAGPGPWEELGVTGYLCVPLTDRGRILGTLTLLATAGRPADGRTVALAEELARRAAASARNARQYAQRVRLARDLQAGLLLPELPSLPGATLAAFYEPAGEGLEIGGDFYDVFELGDDRWAFMVGDVCGRGALAATTTGLVRHTARAAARLLNDPVAVARAVNTALLERSPHQGTGFVTLVYGELARTGGLLTADFVRAGHTPPLRHRADGTTEILDVPGMLLGVTPDPVLRPGRVVLRPGDSLVTVTDGITEARSAAGVLFDERGLAAALAACEPRPTTARATLDAVTRALGAFTEGSEANDDDRAALVITAA
ncbi:SpoIIE family protein phosphatase [Streptomyces sp. HB2AG]|uniref:SpoIIE family protein phosphatase n=1 Tax=Streptomyces sp. HB2AG TaxID=2983400 RepID=UPI0022AB0BD4|nr:SpoIIE family protein phosphatase [Streptomyces sp. HB2AG]MCZ2523578.1 SpoIIE family protein phosphatase [Streptomyces sp. HB2AG]